MKTITLLKRPETKDVEQFEREWSDIHRSSAALNSWYTRNRFRARGLRGEAFPFDGVSTRNVIGATSHLFERELEITDPALSYSFEAEAMTVKAGTGRIKLIILSRRHPDLSPKAFREYWQNVHGKLTLAQDQFSAHLRGYRQNYIRPGSLRRLDEGTVPDTRYYDGMMEMWFDDTATMTAAFESDQYKSAMFPDEANFVARGFSIAFVADELSPDPTDLK